jgi:hypothetical protein
VEWVRYLMAASVLSCWAGPAASQDSHHPKNDYPTAARADFVIGCLMEHQFKHEALGLCACKIDAIADEMTYDEYDQADTILGVQRNGGMGRANELFRDTPIAHQIMAKFHHAQGDADKVCKG